MDDDIIIKQADINAADLKTDRNKRFRDDIIISMTLEEVKGEEGKIDRGGLIALLKEVSIYLMVNELDEKPNEFIVTTEFKDGDRLLDVVVKIDEDKLILSYLLNGTHKLQEKLMDKIMMDYILDKADNTIEPDFNGDLFLISKVNIHGEDLQKGMIAMIQYAIKFNAMIEAA